MSSEPFPPTESAEPSSPPSRRILWLIGGGSIILPGLVIILLYWGIFALLELPYRLLVGWVPHLGRTLPAVAWSPALLLKGAGLACAAVVGSSLLLRAWTSLPADRRWKGAIGFSILTGLVFGAAMSAGGVLHQAGWLLRAEWIESDLPRTRGVRSQSTEAFAKIHATLEEEAWEKIKEPKPMNEAALTEASHAMWWRDEDTARLSQASAQTDEPPEAWRLIARNWPPTHPEAPALISPRRVGGKWIVVFNTWWAKEVSDEEFAKLHASLARP